jgi:hypothetical protein
MSENFEKQIKELLIGVKGPTAKAITIMAMNMDEKLDAILDAINKNKIETDARIDSVKKETNEKFSKLKVVIFFSEHYYLLLIIVFAILIVSGINNDKIQLITKLIK